MDADMQEMVNELEELLKSVRGDLGRAKTLAETLSERTDIQVLSSIEVAQFGVKSATRDLPESGD